MAAKVSIIIPVYGVEKYIERCAISLFEQTLDDIEYIFVNDCTPDRSIEILKDVLNRFPNRVSQVHILNMPYNSGQAAVRKLGIENATGEYIIHCDSDDWVELTAYEKLYKCAITNNSDIVFCDFFKSDGNKNTYISRPVNVQSKNLVIKSVSQKALWSLWGTLARRRKRLRDLRSDFSSIFHSDRRRLQGSSNRREDGGSCGDPSEILASGAAETGDAAEGL